MLSVSTVTRGVRGFDQREVLCSIDFQRRHRLFEAVTLVNGTGTTESRKEGCGNEHRPPRVENVDAIQASTE